jgi:predicted Zn-dependent protease
MSWLRPTLVFILLTLALTACSDGKDGDTPNPDNDFNAFGVDRDKKLGRQFSNQIASDTSGYDVLDSARNPEAYGHLYRIRNNILDDAVMNYQETFRWQVRIIDNDSTLNAFATPGGYLYFYTGLIRYLDNEADFAGVMAHEMAHAARRHSTDQLTKKYGLSLVIQLALGNEPGQLVQIVAGLANLKFSRSDESEADEFGVQYLNPTAYDARGVAGFFEKLEQQGQTGSTPQFLSTHPKPDNRVENIRNKWKELGSKDGGQFSERYRDFQQSLP